MKPLQKAAATETFAVSSSVQFNFLCPMKSSILCQVRFYLSLIQL